jgi:hypothetical protein
MMQHYRIQPAHSPAIPPITNYQSPITFLKKPIMEKSIDPAALRLTQFSHGGG